MANLTRVAYVTRKAINYSLIAIITILVVKTSGEAFKKYWRSLHPLPPPPPNVAFGKLPPLRFDEKLSKPQKEFILQTIEGDLPKLPDIGKVYFVVDKEHKFLALDQTNKIAQNLGFLPQPQKIEEDLFRYQNETLQTTLTINPLTKTFRYQYPYAADQTLTTIRLLSQNEVVDAAQSFLNLLQRDHTDLSPAKIKITLLKFTPSGTQGVSSLSEANLARVDFFRDDIENQYPIYPQSLDEANVSLLVTSSTIGNRQVLEAHYTYFYINREKFATYPLKPISQAWEEVRLGKYHLAKLSALPETPTIPVRRIYIAYFDPHYPTNFLQPIYVFKGDYDFSAFVPAISIEWVAE